MSIFPYLSFLLVALFVTNKSNDLNHHSSFAFPLVSRDFHKFESEWAFSFVSNDENTRSILDLRRWQHLMNACFFITHYSLRRCYDKNTYSPHNVCLLLLRYSFHLKGVSIWLNGLPNFNSKTDTQKVFNRHLVLQFTESFVFFLF